MRGTVVAMALIAMWGSGAGAQPAIAPVDYAAPASWICRPATDDGTCSTELDAMRVDGMGARALAPYAPAAAPPIDCFYVYPTASGDATTYSDMKVDESEERAVHAQAARLGARCRLFVPAYRQLTGGGLNELLKAGGNVTASVLGQPYRDILAAWRSYLARDNHGRGVVLVGHSQGAMILKKLIAEEIDGKPAQRLLVAAYLAGNPDLGAASFRAIRPCANGAQTGCLVAWSSYGAGYAGARSFGGSDGGAPVCVNPAAIGGGRGMLDAYLPKPARAPDGDPPYVEAVGQLSAECVTDANGAVLRVTVEPGRYADLLTAAFAHAGRAPTWGLHVLDINLVQGNMLDLIASQSAAWTKTRR